MTTLLAQLPDLPRGAIETWLLCAAAVAVIIGTIRKVLPPNHRVSSQSEFLSREEFRLFQGSAEKELTALRDRIDSRHLAVMEAIDKLRKDLLAEDHQRQARLSAIEASWARLDERTRS